MGKTEKGIGKPLVELLILENENRHLFWILAVDLQIVTHGQIVYAMHNFIFSKIIIFR